MRNKKSNIKKIFHWLPIGLSIFVTVWNLWLLIGSLYGNDRNYILSLSPVLVLIVALLIFKLTERSSNSNTKSVNIISVELERIDVENYRTSDWILDDSTEPIQYGAHGECMIWFLLYRTYWFAVDIGKKGGHDFYAFDVRKIANDANMPIPEDDKDIIFYKREWLTRFLRDLSKREYFLDFRNNDDELKYQTRKK